MINKKEYCNYRVVVEKEVNGEDYYSVREVYYEDDKPTSWTAAHQYPGGETLEELVDDIELMRKSFNKPVLREVGDELK